MTYESDIKHITIYQEFDICGWDISLPRSSTVWNINGKEIKQNDKLFADIIDKRSTCPYCAMDLKLLKDKKYPPRYQQDEHHIKIQICTCGYWQAYERGGWERGKDEGSYFANWGAGIQKRFNLDCPDQVLDELTRYFSANSNQVNGVNPKVFERIVGECFRANWKPVDVRYVGGPADGGVDIILVMADGGPWLIQCKRRQSDKAVESVKTVRELLGTLVEYKTLRGIVVSSADHFTYYAQRLANSSSVISQGYEIKLVDRGILREMLEGIKVDTIPWKTFFRRTYI